MIKLSNKINTFFSFVIAVFLISLSSCKDSSDKNVLKKEYIDVIERYIDEDTNSQNHISYLILPVKECARNDFSLSGFLIGPLYEHITDSFKKENFKLIYSYKGKSVYIYTNIFDILTFPTQENTIKYCRSDSVSIFENKYTVDAGPNYIKRAWQMIAHNKVVIVKKNVDTLFLPRIKKDLEILP